MNMHEGSPSTFPIEGKTLAPVYECHDCRLEFASTPDLQCRARGPAAITPGKASPPDAYSLGELPGLFRDWPGHRLHLWLDCGARDLLRGNRHTGHDPGGAGLSRLEHSAARVL